MQRAGLWERARVWRRPCSEIERAAATRGATRGRGASFADAATRCLIEHVIEHVEWMVVLLLHAANSGLRVATLTPKAARNPKKAHETERVRKGTLRLKG